jgi:hypothetical protein
MLEQIPRLRYFSNAYWNQTGDLIYGNLEFAFRQFIADLLRMPDKGVDIRRELYGELMLLLDNVAYDRWVNVHRTDPDTIEAVGGRFIFPDEIRPLIAILDEDFTADI